MSEQPFERLAYRNRFVKRLIQQTTGTECFVPFVSLQNEDNLVVLKLSAAQINRMFSALITGADIVYPDESMQIMVDFLSGIHCPPIMEAQDCYEYPSYANFIKYTPTNPYIEPDAVPDGYAFPPFLVNGEDGNDIPNYEHYDVIVPTAAITLDLDWFETISGQLPTIEIMVSGAGKVFLKMLTLAGGGLAVITVDNPPDLIDIIAGIVTSSDNIIDLNQDLISLPPETAQELIFEVDTVGSGLHTIYIVFLPILDDSLIPVRFGGGFRGVQLCDFVEQPEMGLTDIRFNGADCNLEVLNNGVWEVVNGWEDWLACVPSGGGGGASAISAVTRYNQLSATINFTNTAYARLTDSEVAYTFTKSKALIGVGCSSSNAGSQSNFFRPLVRQGSTDINGIDGTEARTFGTTLREVWAWDVFDDLALVNSGIFIDAKVSGSTGAVSNNFNLVFVIIEFDELSDLFVEDVRIIDRELQKKIGGVWITVTDSLATILNSIETTANNALAAAAAAQATANNAQTIANGAVTVNNTQNTRLNNIENDIEDLELDAAAQAVTLANHETRIDALEASMGSDSPYFLGGVWSVDYTWSDASPTVILPFTLDQGIYTSLGIASDFSPAPNIASVFSTAVRNNQVTHVGVKLIALGHTNPMNIKVTINDASGVGFSASFVQTSFVSGEHIFWMRVPNSTALFKIEAEGNNADRFYMRGLRVLGRGTAPF